MIRLLKKLHLFDKVVGRLIPSIFAAIGEGDFGPIPAKVYWALKGKKLAIGVIGWGAAELLFRVFDSGACTSFGPQACEYVQAFAVQTERVMTFLLAIGLADAATHYEPPTRPAGAR